MALMRLMKLLTRLQIGREGRVITVILHLPRNRVKRVLKSFPVVQASTISIRLGETVGRKIGRERLTDVTKVIRQQLFYSRNFFSATKEVSTFSNAISSESLKYRYNV